MRRASWPGDWFSTLVDVKTVAYRSPNEEDAKVESVRRCESEGKGRSCTVIYSACSMSEFKPFR